VVQRWYTPAKEGTARSVVGYNHSHFTDKAAPAQSGRGHGLSLPVGTRLGPYEIQSPLGAGGMGEVYRARDCRLNRTVALKILPGHFATDADLRARFEREARAISRLNHPHICALYDIGHSDVVKFLVLEYLEGETLADRLRRGALPLDQTLRHAIAMAEALDAAHRSGIVHRDLKPGNVMLTRAGVKLLDFGLAKAEPMPAHALGGDDPPDGVSALPTRERPLTTPGALIGTVQYMAPEQLEGKDVDARTDVFAFGAIVYEMATGKRAFQGGSPASLISAILKNDPPPIGASQPLARPLLDHIVQRCLAKDRDERWQTASDLKRELKWVAESASRPGTPGAAHPARLTKRTALAWILGGMAALSIAGPLWWGRTGSPRSPVWFSILPPEPPRALVPPPPAPAVSPDGKQIAFVALDPSGETMLWVRALGSPSARALPGTNNAARPFWSPDGRALGFFADRKLRRVDIAGGSPLVLADAPTDRGGSWGAGVIVFSPSIGAPLYRVSAAGGPVTPATELEESAARGENSHRHPHFLPDGRHFLYWRRSPDQGSTGLYVGSLDSKDVKLVQVAGSRAEYASGHLLFGRDEALFAQPFDLGRFEITGPAVRIAENLGFSGGDLAAYAFSTSRNGTLAYWSGGTSPISQLTWFDRSGRPLGVVGEPGEYHGLAMAPDERRVALERHDPKTNTVDVWLMDLTTQLTTRLTSVAGFDAWAATPVWSPDGSGILFTDFTDAFHLRGLRGGRVETLTHGLAGSNWLLDWSPTGEHVVFQRSDPQTALDIWVLPLRASGTPFPYANTSFFEGYGQVPPTVAGSRTPPANRDGRRCTSMPSRVRKARCGYRPVEASDLDGAGTGGSSTTSVCCRIEG
jgi:serine/threonine protein kinase/Tol biopolymer transport system component